MNTIPAGAKSALLNIYQDAWNGINGWVASNFASDIEQTSISDINENVDLGICPYLNSEVKAGVDIWEALETMGLSALLDGIWEGYWKADGNGSITVNNLAVGNISDLSTSSSEQSNTISYSNNTLVLPMSFSSLTVSGDFSYSQQCQKRDDVFMHKHQTMSGNGTLQQPYANGQINFYASLSSTGSLTFSTATLTGAGQLTGDLQSQSPSGYLDISAIVDLFTGSPYGNALSNAIQTAFDNANVAGNAVITAMNTELQNMKNSQAA